MSVAQYVAQSDELAVGEAWSVAAMAQGAHRLFFGRTQIQVLARD